MKLGQLQSHYDPELSRAKAGQKDPSGVHTCMIFNRKQSIPSHEPIEDINPSLKAPLQRESLEVHGAGDKDLAGADPVDINMCKPWGKLP